LKHIQLHHTTTKNLEVAQKNSTNNEYVKYERINLKPVKTAKKTALVNNFLGNFKASKLNTSDSETILFEGM